MKEKVIIIGGGVSGLFLGFFLKKHSIDFIIYERSSKQDLAQGFSLTLQGYVLQILKDYGIYDKFYELGVEVNTQSFYDTDGNLLVVNHKNNNLPIARKNIFSILLNEIENHIVFSTKITDIPNKKEDQILVICDGIHSHLRQYYLPLFTFNNLNLINLYGIFNTTKFQKEEIQINDGRYRMFIKPYDNTRSMWELTYPYDYDKTITNDSPKGDILQHVLKITNGWKFKLPTETILESEILAHELKDHVPTLEELNSIPENTFLIGDVIHPMCPFIGKGANESIIDSFNILKVINGEMTRKDYNIDMYTRSQSSVLKSRQKSYKYHFEK